MVDQVHHHRRRHNKNMWGLVAKYMNKSGGGWDDSTNMVTLSQSTLNDLSANNHGILRKPIHIIDNLQELFSGFTTDGSFMQDASTTAEHNNDDTNIFDMNGMANCDMLDGPQGHDSFKLESDVMKVKRWLPSLQLVAKFHHLAPSQ